MRVDCIEIEFASDQEDGLLDGGQACEVAGAAFGGLEQAVDGFQEAVSLAGLYPGRDALQVAARGRRPPSSARP